VVERGHKVPAVNLWVKGKPKARLSFETIGSNLTPYSFLQIFLRMNTKGCLSHVWKNSVSWSSAGPN
jgi:hypothetical protein